MGPSSEVAFVQSLPSSRACTPASVLQTTVAMAAAEPAVMETSHMEPPFQAMHLPSCFTFCFLPE